MVGQIGVLLLALSVVPREVPAGSEIPNAWDLNEIAKATPPYGAEGRVYVLAWIITSDERPHCVERCLVLRRHENNAGATLAHLYRWQGAEKAEWQLSQMHVTGAVGTKFWPDLWIMHSHRFKRPPSNYAIYAALDFEGVYWNFELEKDASVIDCRVCERAWREAIGEQPTKFFHRETMFTAFLRKWGWF
jgi:hypothetical protein